MNNDFKTLCDLCSPNASYRPQITNVSNWHNILQLAIRHKVVPVLANRMKLLEISPPEKISQLITQHVKQNLLNGMKQTSELIKLTELFDNQDIPFLVFKGIAFNHLAGIELTQRHMGDIDILLADYDDFDKTDIALKSFGYQRLTLPSIISMNEHQKRHLKRYEKDIIYYHPEKEISLELHFKLFLSEKMLPLPISEIYKARSQIKIGKTLIPVMNKADHLLYLLVHGSVCRWFRLKWLCDIPLLSNNGLDYQSPAFIKRAESLGIERMVYQGLKLSHELLKMPIAPESYFNKKYSQQSRFLINQAKASMLAEEQQNIPRLKKVQSLIRLTICYLPVLRADFSYKFDYFRSYLIKVSDWEDLPLPSPLFWLYYPLRPILWLRRQLK